MNLSEVVLLVVMVVVIFGATRISTSRERSDAPRSQQSSRWTWSDWVLLGAAILSVSVAIALEVLKSRAT